VIEKARDVKEVCFVGRLLVWMSSFGGLAILVELPLWIIHLPGPEYCSNRSWAVEGRISGPGVHVAEESLEWEVGWGSSADVKCMVVTQAPNRMNSTPSTLGRLRISRMSKKESCGALFSE
jgi:hypothetical protein